MIFGDVISLVQVVIWPSVVLVLVFVFRRELPKLALAISRKISRLSAAGVTLEFAAAEPVAEILIARLDEIREPSTTGPPPPSGIASLLELANASPRADYLVVDLRDGQAWLNSRLYLFAVVLPSILALRCFVFVGTRREVPRCFLGLAPPESVARVLEMRYPWLREAMLEALLIEQLVGGQHPTRHPIWSPYSDTHAALARLTQGSAGSTWDVSRAEALGEIVQALARPIDLFQPGQIEMFVDRFLNNPKVRRPYNAAILDANWVHLDAVDEHASWIRDERDLLNLLNDDIHRQLVMIEQLADDEALVKAVLRKRGNFVAAVDPDRRFDRLIDRAALLEKVAAKVGSESLSG